MLLNKLKEINIDFYKISVFYDIYVPCLQINTNKYLYVFLCFILVLHVYNCYKLISHIFLVFFIPGCSGIMGGSPIEGCFYI